MPARDLIFTVLGRDRASRVFDNVGDRIDRLGSRAIKVLGGVQGASAAAAAGVGASVAALPVAFAGLGAFALRENTAVRQSFEDLSEEVRTGLMADAAPLEQAYVGAAQRMGSAYQGLRPQMAAAFQASVPHVAELTEGVVEFAEGAMPGMVTSVQRAGPVMSGLRSLLRDTGAGLGEFFEITSEGAEDAGQGLEHYGQLMRDLLPEVGGILVDLSGLWAEHGGQAVDIVTRLVGVVGDLSNSALPTVSDALGVALDVLSGVLAVIEPITGALGPMIGAWLALTAAMRGIRAVRGVADSVATSVSNLNTQLDKTAKGGGGRLQAAGRGLVGLFGGPFGIAVAAATAGLALFGQESQDAANTQRSLASALRESNGQFDANARSALFNSESYQDVKDSVQGAGLSHKQYIDALVQGGPALDGLRSRLERIVEAGRSQEFVGNTTRDVYTDQAKAAMDLLGATDGLRGSVEGAVEEFGAAADASDVLAGSMHASVPGADALRESLTTLADQTADTTDKADALNDVWRRLFGIQIGLEEATANWEGGLADLAEQIEGVKTETGNWRGALLNANGTVNTSTEAGRNLLENLVQQGDEYRTLAQTAFDTALQQGKSQKQATEAARTAVHERRAQFIREAEQLGFTRRQAQRLADRYLGMPRDVFTGIHQPGILAALDRASDLRHRLNQIPDHVSTTVTTIFTSRGTGPTATNRLLSSAGFKDGGQVQAFDDGGAVQAFPNGFVRGPGGPRSDDILALLSNREFVSTAASAARNLDALEAGNRGAKLIAIDRSGVVQMANGGLAGAAGQILGHLRRGGGLFEDFSFRGNSQLVRRFNDQLADMFAARHGRVDVFGTNAVPGARGIVERFLRSVATPAPAQQPRQQPVVVSVDAGGLDDALLRWLRGAIRVRGGNVQVVLGKGGR